MGIADWNWSLILRVAGIGAAVGTIVLAIFSLPAMVSDDFPAGLIINAYLIIFALMIIGAEARVQLVTNNFEFLRMYPGRGCFYLFVSTVCFIYGGSSTLGVFNIVCGVVHICNGGCHIYMYMSNSESYRKERDAYLNGSGPDSEMGQAAAGVIKKGAKKAAKDEIKSNEGVWPGK